MKICMWLKYVKSLLNNLLKLLIVFFFLGNGGVDVLILWVFDMV